MNDSIILAYGWRDSSAYNGNTVKFQDVAIFTYNLNKDSVQKVLFLGDSLGLEVEGAYGLVKENDSIYVSGGTYGWSGYWAGPPGHFFLTRINIKSWKIEEERYFGGDYYYNLYGIRRTSDGGYLAWGTVYDPQVSAMQRDPFFMKIDSAGIITHASHAIEALDVLAFPNPGKDRLNFRLPAEMAGTAILYDLNGKAVLQSPFQGKAFSLETASLPAGVYVYRLLTSRQQVLTGKWIKVE